MGNKLSGASDNKIEKNEPAAAAGLNNGSSGSGSSPGSQTCSNKPFADELNAERRVVLQLRQGCGLKDSNKNRIHAAFDIFNVAATVASFSPLPPFELKGELLKSFKEYLLGGKPLSTTDRFALSRVTTVGDHFLSGRIDLKTIDLSPLSNLTTVGVSFLCGCTGLKTIDLTPLSNVTTVGRFFLSCCLGLNTIELSPLSNLTTVGDNFLIGCSDTVQAQGKFLSRRGREW